MNVVVDRPPLRQTFRKTRGERSILTRTSCCEARRSAASAEIFRLLGRGFKVVRVLLRTLDVPVVSHLAHLSHPSKTKSGGEVHRKHSLLPSTTVSFSQDSGYHTILVNVAVSCPRLSLYKPPRTKRPSVFDSVLNQGLNVVIVSMDDKFLKDTFALVSANFPGQEFRKVGATFSPGVDYMDKIK